MTKEGRYIWDRRRLAQPLAAAFWLGCLAMTSAVAVQAGSLPLMATATVAKRATLKVLAQPPSVLVTEADLGRGYVEVLAPVQLAVQSNSPGGYILVFESRGDLVSDARVRGLGGEIQLGANGVVPRMAAAAGVSNTTHELTFRFTLSGSAQEGTHAWPMQISAVPR